MSYRKNISRFLLPAAIVIGMSVFGSRDGLSAELKKVRTEYERNRRAAFQVGTESSARNPEQRWLTHFDGRGFSVESCTAPAGATRF